MKISHPLLASIIGGLALMSSARAETQSDGWTYVGGALNPNTYSALGNPGKFRPPVLFPDALADHGATIGVTGATFGGLGSNSEEFQDGYGFYYTFFSSSVSFTLQTVNVLADLDTITVSFNSGGATTFSASSLTLNYNLAHSSESALTFLPTSLGPVDTPIGSVEMTNYTWTWNVSAFGASSGFSTAWTAGQHTTFADLQLVQQSVPEPSSLGLMALGVAGLGMLRRRPLRTRKSGDVSSTLAA